MKAFAIFDLATNPDISEFDRCNSQYSSSLNGFVKRHFEQRELARHSLHCLLSHDISKILEAFSRRTRISSFILPSGNPVIQGRTSPSWLIIIRLNFNAGHKPLLHLHPSRNTPSKNLSALRFANALDSFAKKYTSSSFSRQ